MNAKARIGLLVCLLAGTAAGAAGSAGNTPGKFYVGADVGKARSDAQLSQQFFGPDVGSESGDATGFKLRVGYQFSRYVALEVGYADFGDVSLDDIPYTCPPGAAAPCTFNVDSQLRGALVDVVGSWPFAGRWALNGRLGWFRAETDTREEDPDIAGTRQRYSATNGALLYGAGVSFAVTPRLDVELDWAQFDQIDLGLGLGGAAAVYDLGSSSLTSIGVRFRF